MRTRTALSTLPRLAQTEDAELARFAKTRLGDEIPVAVDDLQVARDLLRALGAAFGKNDPALWKKLREARDVLTGAATPAAAPSSSVAAPADPPPKPAAQPELPSHMLPRQTAAPWSAPATPAPAPAYPQPSFAAAPAPPVAPAAPIASAPPVAPVIAAPAAPAAAHNAFNPPEALVRTKGMGFVAPIGKALPFERATPETAAKALASTPARPLPPPEEDKLGMTVAADPGPSSRPMPFPGSPSSGPPSQPQPEAAISIPKGQRFTLAQYVSLRADFEAAADRRAVLATYGVSGEEELAQIDAVWLRTFAEQPALAAKHAKLRAEYTAYLASRRR